MFLGFLVLSSPGRRRAARPALTCYVLKTYPSLDCAKIVRAQDQSGTWVLDKERSQANRPCDGALHVLTASRMSKEILTSSTTHVLYWLKVWQAGVLE